jgi:hypothetical protein
MQLSSYSLSYWHRRQINTNFGRKTWSEETIWKKTNVNSKDVCS